jgi:hypothetical protein
VGSRPRISLCGQAARPARGFAGAGHCVAVRPPGPRDDDARQPRRPGDVARLAAHWFSDYLSLQLVDGEAKLVAARALVGFHESEFTVPARRVRQLWPKSPSAKAANECWAWLEQLAKDHPDRQPQLKPQLWKEAKRRWPSLSKRGFNRGWAKAVRAAAGWTRPVRRGRPRRNPLP